MSKLYVAKSSNLSLAWVEVFFQLMEPGTIEMAPAVITISEFDEKSLPIEVPGVQEAINKANDQQCRTVASTIFPNSLWVPKAQNDARRLYSRYEKVWPVIARCMANSKGVYFRRLTAYAPEAHPKGSPAVNQLEHIVATYKSGNHRHSALQASIFDPTRDHTNIATMTYFILPMLRYWAGRR